MKLGLTQAIASLTQGKSATIVSVIGKRYTAAQLSGKMIGKHTAVFNDVGMTKEEKRGEWRIDN